MEKLRKDFFTVYEEGLKKNRLNCVKLGERLKDEYGFIISPRSLQRYRKKLMRPDFETAKKICEALQYSFTDDEIQDLVDNAKNQREYSFSDHRYIERVIRVRIDKLSSEYNSDDEILAAIKQRIADTQPLELGNFNRYISDLIRKDLAEHILPDAEK